MIFPNVGRTIGRTPKVELRRMTEGLAGRVAAKLEMRNPCGSVKDRLGVALIEDAERRGILRSGMTLVEATGGNTGIGLVFAATIRGYRLFRRSPEAEPPTTIDGMMERIVTQPLRSVTSSSS